MEPALKTRLIGAAVLVAIAVIVVPMFFPGTPPSAGSDKSLSLNIPAAPSSQVQSRTLSLAPASSAGAAGGPPAPATVNGASASDDHVATVNIASRVPQDVHPENDTAPASTQQAPAQAPKQASARPPSKPAPATKAPASKAPAQRTAAASSLGRAAHGHFSLNLGAYTQRANAKHLMKQVEALGYPVAVSGVQIGGKPAARVTAGPFDSRAAAEAARLKIKARIAGVPAKLDSSASDQTSDQPASALPAHKAGGWAVQLGAFSHKADALKLRDKVRKAGFDGYVDDVDTGGKTLWRVRVGPEAQRDAAEKTLTELKSKLKLGGVVVTTS